MVKAAIFDMDGLLIDSEQFWRLSQKETLANVGIKLTNIDVLYTMGWRIDEVVAYWYSKQPWDGPTNSQIQQQIVDRVIEFIKSDGAPMPGVIKTLDFFIAKNIPMAIASSSSETIIDTVVDKLNIRKYFEHIYSAQHEQYGKPHPGTFISTANLLDVPPTNCLVFEDSPYGVLAAKAAKMKCVAVPAP